MKSKDIDALYMRWDLVDGNREDDDFAKKLCREIDRAVRKARREEWKKLKTTKRTRLCANYRCTCPDCDGESP